MQRTKHIIREAIADLVSNNNMFTALDVSIKVKAALQSEDLQTKRHRELKFITHNEMLVHGDYSTKLININASTKAILYYPFNKDPDDYKPLNILGKDWIRVPDARGVVNVPIPILKCIMVGIGDLVHVWSEPNKIVMSKVIPSSATKLATYVADPNGAIRLNKKCLATVNSEKLSFKVDGSQVIAEPVSI